MTTPTNADRVARAFAILRQYGVDTNDPKAPLQQHLGDLLADIRHLCASVGDDLSLEMALATSLTHFEQEQEEDRERCTNCGEVLGRFIASGLCDDCNASIPVGHEDEEDVCSECGDELDLDGYDGRCGNCADNAEGK